MPVNVPVDILGFGIFDPILQLYKLCVLCGHIDADIGEFPLSGLSAI